MLNVAINPTIALVNVENGNPLTVEESKETILSALRELGEKHPSMIPIKAYEDSPRKTTVSLNISDGKHLCPSFNFVSVTAMQCEFTSAIKARNIAFLELDQKHVAALRAYRDTISADHNATGDLDFIARWSTLELGTCGSRSTNRDMAYAVNIDYLPTAQILTAIAPYVKIINKDQSNRNRSFGYVLTCREEVEAFMAACGLADVYLKALAKVEAYQVVNKLKEQYDGERLSKDATPLIHKVSLSA
jgi:hypothetical protein